MILTHQNIHSIATGGCGFNTAQLHLLNVTNLKRGWLTRLIGTEIPDDTFALLQKLKGAKPIEQRKLVPDARPFPTQPAPRKDKPVSSRERSNALRSDLDALAVKYASVLPLAEILAETHRFAARFLKEKGGEL